MWANIKGEVQDYEKEKVSFALYTRGRYVEEVSPCMPINSVQNGVVWETISSITLWVLWTSRRRRIFQQIQWNVVEVVKEIWVTLVHTLKGEYDAIKGDSDVVFRKQEVFKKRWERMKVFCMVNGCIRWRYQPPLWVFPPSTWGMWPCITVIIDALGHMHVYSRPRVVERVKIYDEISFKSL